MVGSLNIFVAILLLPFIAAGQIVNKRLSNRKFQIDRAANGFLKDGLPFRYISGSIHYFRVHPDDWRDRLRKLKYAGCNAVETYVEWSSHEPENGVYDFNRGLNIFEFLDIAYEEGLLVILRPGPYICAERDMGGFPYWLLRENPHMQLRTMDASYLHYVDRWFTILLPMLRPFLYENGGPVIMMQIENEYGSYFACDFYYTSHLRDLTRSILGDEVILFSTDGDSTNYLKCGKIPDVYATVDFGSGTNVEKAFQSQRAFEPHGPLVNSEFYPGWLDHWGEPHATVPSEKVAKTLDEMLAVNASVNIYVFHGGTNFGLTAGANLNGRYQPCPTSYDYDAPLNEAGDPTEKYFAIRNVTQKYVNLPPGPVPGPSPKGSYGDVDLTPEGSLLDFHVVLDHVKNSWPLTFEALSQSNGIVIYSTTIPHMIPDPAILRLYDLHDRGYVFVDQELAAIVTREQEMYEVPITGKANQKLTIVVESQGRVGYGKEINDFKGITTNVTLGSTKLRDWRMTPIPLVDSTMLTSAVKFHKQMNLDKFPYASTDRLIIYRGTFNVPSRPADTFVRLDGWSKGYVWINYFLLGRYWPAVGPQKTLYVPHGILKKGKNSVMLLELERSPCEIDANFDCKISLVDTPEIDGPTPLW